jgi:hypothetical protein
VSIIPSARQCAARREWCLCLISRLASACARALCGVICILSRTTVTFVCLTFTFDRKVDTPSTYIFSSLAFFLYKWPSPLILFRMSVVFIAYLCWLFGFFLPLLLVVVVVVVVVPPREAFLLGERLLTRRLCNNLPVSLARELFGAPATGGLGLELEPTPRRLV